MVTNFHCTVMWPVRMIILKIYVSKIITFIGHFLRSFAIIGSYPSVVEGLKALLCMCIYILNPIDGTGFTGTTDVVFVSN